jgi:hypothetical protein
MTKVKDSRFLWVGVVLSGFSSVDEAPEKLFVHTTKGLLVFNEPK